MRGLAPGSAADTIFALATGAGRSAIAIVRLSGSHSGPILSALCGDLPEPRLACLRRLRDANEHLLDQAVVLWLPGPGSYTGEDVAELHLHGGRAVLEGVTLALVEAGARPADAGEFTRRAVTHGKLDLIEAEAVADLIEANTATQRHAALLQLSGEQSRLLVKWTAQARELLSLQEGLIDFSEDEVPLEAGLALEAGVQQLSGEIARGLADSVRGERLREGLTFVLAGAPNTGKSSLLNALAQRNAAIVAPTPGTTRDAVQVELEFGGVPVTLVDTAGLRETDDLVEAEGVRRAYDLMAGADLVILLTDQATSLSPVETNSVTLLVKSKTDLAAAPPGFVGINVVEEGGLDELKARLHGAARALTPQGAQPAFSRARHQAALRDAHERLSLALQAAQPDIRGEELRLCLAALGRLTGITEAEDVLDSVFATFCVGK